jgi:hypothetical protein
MAACLQVVKDNTIAERKGMGCENVDWIHWAQKRAKLGSAVNAVIIIREWCSELSSGMYCRVKSGMMEAVRTSETSVGNYFRRQYIPEDNSEHHTRRRENLKSQIIREVQNCLLGCILHVPLKRRPTIILDGSTSQKTILNIILAAVRAWNLK